MNYHHSHKIHLIARR